MKLLLALLLAIPLSGADLNQPDVKVQVRIKQMTAQGEFNDSLYFTQAEFAALKQSDLDAAKKARVDNWVAIVSNPPKPVAPTKQDLIDQADQLQQQVDRQIQSFVPYTKADLTALKTQAQTTLSSIKTAISGADINGVVPVGSLRDIPLVPTHQVKEPSVEEQVAYILHWIATIPRAR